MRKLPRVIVSCLAVMGLALPAHGQEFRGLGFLDPDADNPYSTADGISGDGTTVVGESNFQAFRWTAATPGSLEPLGFLPGGVSSAGRGVSAIGSVVVGWSGTLNGSRAFRWTSVAGMDPPNGLGTLGGASPSSEARGVSDDGSVVVGQSFAIGNLSGFRWTQSTGMVELDKLTFDKGDSAWAVSGGGGVAVGRAGCCEGGGAVGLRWEQAAGNIAEILDELPGLPDAVPWSAAAGISANGLVIVGGGGGPQASFRWEAGVTSPLTPPLLPSPSSGMDASADGSVIVGAYTGESGGPVSTPFLGIMNGRAFIWTAADGMRDLKDVLTGLGLGPLLQGWTLQIATGISDDGNIITGYGRHNDVSEGWVAALSGSPFPSSPPDDDGPEFRPFRLVLFYAALRESHGFLWHPSKGPIPIDPDPPPELLGPAVEGGARWSESAAGPRAIEQLWAIRSETRGGEADFRVLRHDGRAWSLDWTSLGPGDALLGSRSFDLAYEGHSGDALVVYESGAGTPRYRTFSEGIWSEERVLPQADAPPNVARREEGTVQWVELAARPGTDEVALAYLDQRGGLRAWTWDGNRWLGESATILAQGLRPVGNRPFDIAYEALSGTLIAAWSVGRQAGFFHARMGPGTNTWSAPTPTALPGLHVGFIDLASEPSSNLVAGAFMSLRNDARGRRGPGLALSMWDSQHWQRPEVFDNRRPGPASDGTLAALPGAVGWSGTSRVALFVHAGSGLGTFGWARWTDETGWLAEPDVALRSDGQVASVRLEGSTDGGLLSVLSDSEGQLHVLDFDEEGAWQEVFDRLLPGTLPTPDDLPFALAHTREHVLLVGDPAAASGQVADLPLRGEVELLSFALVPRGERSRVDVLSFALDGDRPVNRSAFNDSTLVVDDNANGTVDPDETTMVAGSGGVNASQELVFFEPFDVTAPTHYVLRSNITAPLGTARLTVFLPASGVVIAPGLVRGGALRCLDSVATLGRRSGCL